MSDKNPGVVETTHTYQKRRGELQHYFGRTASENWVKMTSDSPLNRIRATVRAGREQMRATLLSYLPADFAGRRLFDAGCGTGMLSMEAARLSPKTNSFPLSTVVSAISLLPSASGSR